jgi:hypothetical protein
MTPARLWVVLACLLGLPLGVGSFTVVMEGGAAVSHEQGEVRISNIRIVEGRFPALTPSDSNRLFDALRGRMTREDVVVALERITASVERAETATRVFYGPVLGDYQ